MELSEKILAARQEAGLSQRQLCGDVITRNMLSQIEHGTARPSMDTLRYLASRLGKPVSWFLEENAVFSPNQQVMAAAREACAGKNYAAARKILADYREPDPIFDSEKRLLSAEADLGLAEEAISRGKTGYARELIGGISTDQCRFSREIQRQKQLLLARISSQKPGALARDLPDIDEDLLLLARAAAQRHNLTRAEHLAESVQNREDPRWQLLRGWLYRQQGAYRDAVDHLKEAEAAYPRETLPLLETCYREMGDYRQAYEYACKIRERDER